MAIQFHCPYCTASIRVGDEAAGKIGKCPKCETKLRVPAPAAVPGSPKPDELPVLIEDDPALPEVAPVSPAVESFAPPEVVFPAADPPSPGLPLIDTTVRSAPSYADRVRRKQGGGWWIGPLLFGGLLVVATGAYWWFSRGTMTGELTGTPVPADEVLTGYIRPAAVDLPRDEYMRLVGSLQQNPVLIETESLRVELRGSRFGLQVLLQPGTDTELVAVNVRSNALVLKFSAEHAGELNRRLSEELRTEATRFLTDWQEAVGSGMELGNVLAYRDGVGVNALLGGLGYHTAALVDNTVYPCVHEDDGGLLYFVVPRGTETFLVTERPMEGGGSVFPGKFEFTVNVDRPPAPSEEPPTPLPVDDDPEPDDEVAEIDDAEMTPEEPVGTRR